MTRERPPSFLFEKLEFIKVLPMPQEIEVANVRATKRTKQIGLFLLLLGLVMPTEWGGMLGTPISWVTEVVPSVRKSVGISPISTLIQGFFGTILLLMPMLFAYLVWGDPYGPRFKYAYEKAESKFSFFVIMYLVGIPLMAFLLYVLFFLPIEVHRGVTPTRAQLIFFLMVSYRIPMAIFGAFLTLGALSISWLLTVFLFGPFLCLYKRLMHHGK
ncbi:hypothetical protein [Polaromonas sp. A23]|uniref:hypothetical protein n=1 Tax=Polaromonas sp. A23 TaxID=1944133 RepID=UPI000986531A|nr:hypothetical protein [Polaromonas sp. A23]OOG36558.1 hypothetical protein B0B52_19785 [Polaromonas sp. A23]